MWGFHGAGDAWRHKERGGVEESRELWDVWDSWERLGIDSAWWCSGTKGVLWCGIPESMVMFRFAGGVMVSGVPVNTVAARVLVW